MGSSADTARGNWFKQHLAGIREEDCTFTSIATGDYNCVGFVVGDYQWWQPSGRRGHYWPASIPLPRPTRRGSATAKAYVKALRTAQFEESPIQKPDPEVGYEKIVIYQGVDGTFTHAAKICADRKWMSKLGEFEDIEHPPPAGRKLGSYGMVYKYLRRELKYAGDPLPDEYKLVPATTEADSPLTHSMPTVGT